MARLRYNGLRGTLGGSLTNSATSVTFSGALTHSNGTSVPTISGGDYFMLTLLDGSGNLAEVVKVTAYTSAATTATIVRGQEGTSGVSHSSGAKFVHGPSAYDFPVFAEAVRNSSDISFNSTSWADVDTALDLTLSGIQVGDRIEYIPQFLCSTQNANLSFDVATIVSGSPVNYFGGTGSSSDNGVLGWYCIPSNFGQVSGSAFYKVQSGDLSSSSVTLRLRAKSSVATTRTILASSTNPLRVWARRVA